MKEAQTDRIVDVVSVVIISFATVFSAWCGYRAATWGGLVSQNFSMSNALHLRAAESLDRANATQAVDVALFTHYIIADLEGHRNVAEYIRSRFRPEMQPAFKAWLATKPATNPAAPRTPFAMKEYSLATRQEAEKFDAQAQQHFDDASRARSFSDRYVLLTVLFASVSFLGGISIKLRPPLHIILVSFGTLVLIGASIAMFLMPTA
ncbi:MAG TPA: hypothetical protein VKG44_06535 [Candidatus Baltobacteraceae bacterium]|nr:hypothetical protein [Candidatus Baltobacteraceae bacterium]